MNFYQKSAPKLTLKITAMRTFFCLLLWFLANVSLAQSGHIFNVKQYGAIGDGQTKDTEAIYAALAACAKAGGGTVYFPAGTYLTGPVHIKDDHITLELGNGATLRASNDFADYPAVYTRWEGIDGYAYSPIIFADSVAHFTLTGPGHPGWQRKSLVGLPLRLAEEVQYTGQ